MTRHPIVPLAEMRPGTIKAFPVGGRRIVVANVDGDLRATDELCPHLAVPLSQGHIEGRCLTCVGHGSSFDVDSGAVIKWMGRRPGLVSSLLSGKPKPLGLITIGVTDGIIYLDL